MRLPLSWLKEWVEFDADPRAIADALTRRGFYVEGVESHGHAYPGIVIARVIEAGQHPNADRLKLCRVDAGGEELSVVCGAPNVATGMRVPLATVGAVLPGGLKIKKSKIRGEVSQGMICSARELALGEDHDGIIDLDAMFAGHEMEIGAPFEDLLPPPDPVFEIEIPFNRPDALGIIGLAREVKAAFTGRWTDVAKKRLANRWKGGDAFDLELEDTEGCPHYIAQTVENVSITPSPAWMVRRLEALGQRAISNVVDVTNLVLFEFGQPLHAFDLDKLEGPAIRVRSARKGERMKTLDGVERELAPEVLLICDAKRPVAVAGVMGGEDSEVSNSTTRLLLECAWFNPRRIRRSARSLGLSTEASKRFERSVDPDIGPAATRRFLELLAEVCPDMKLGPACEVRAGAIEQRKITLRGERAKRLIGAEVPVKEVKTYLDHLEFGAKGTDPWQVTVPTWRPDVEQEDDLVEEIARSWGYDRIPDVPLETGGVYARRSARETVVTRARRAMLARGLTEAWTTSLVSWKEASDTASLFRSGESDGGGAEVIRLANPMSREHECLRPNLVAGLLRATAHNLKQGASAVRLFEVGVGFEPGSGSLPDETLQVAAVVTGPRYAHAHDAAQQAVDESDARGLWDAWLEEMRVDTPEWRAYSGVGWKPGASAEVASGTSRIGWAGTLGRSLLRVWDIEVPVHLFVTRLDGLPLRGSDKSSLRLPGRFPSVRRDLAFFVPANVTHRQLEQTLTRNAGRHLASIELFDIYTGSGTPSGMKSLAYALQWQHDERTLTESEVQTIQDHMVQAVAKELGGKLREQ